MTSTRRRFVLPLALGLGLACAPLALGCKKKDEPTETTSPTLLKTTETLKKVASDSSTQLEKDGPQSAAPSNPKAGDRNPITLDQLDSIEVVLAEPENETTPGKVSTYLLLYDLDQNPASMSGKLELTYTIDDGAEQKRSKDIDTAMFKQQTIPGEEEPSLCFLADSLEVPVGASVRVTARFADKADAEDSITIEADEQAAE